MGQDKVLVIGATGFLGVRIARASARLGHPTFGLIRPSTLSGSSKAELLGELKAAGITLLPGDLGDHDSLVEALKHVDVVISAVAREQLRDQLKLLEAIKQVGHIKRFIPSDFGSEAKRAYKLPASTFLFESKIFVQDAIKASGIPYTIISTNSFANLFVPLLLKIGPRPPPGGLVIFGHAQAYFVDEDDAATYTIKAAVDPRAENKVVYIRPAANIYTHAELLELWEKKSGQRRHKVQLEEEDAVKMVEGVPPPENEYLGVLYSMLIKGDNVGFDVPPDALEATEAYPEVHYTTVEKLIERFL